MSRVLLTEGSITSGLLNLTIPIILMSVLQSLNASVNSIWVGRCLGEIALTAASNANLVMFLLIGAAFGIAMAAMILVGQRFGANDILGAKRAVGTSAAFFAAASVLIGGLGLTFSPLILRAINTPAPSLPLAIPYMRVTFLALLPLFMYAFVMAVLRAVGDSRTPLCFMLLSIALDISLNPVFMFGLGPAPRLGIAGSALATLVAQTVSLSAMVVHLYRRHHVLCLSYEDIRLLKIDGHVVKLLVWKGIPMSCQVLVISLSALLMISVVNRLGVDTTAAFGAALQLWNYAQMPAQAIGQGVSVIAAQNIGAEQWDRLNKIAVVGVLISLTLTGTVLFAIQAIGISAFAPFLPTHSRALALAVHLNSIAAGSYLFFSIPTVLFAVVRAAGAVTVPLAIMATSLLLVRYPIAEALLEHFGADAVWWSFPSSAAVAALFASLHYKFGNWRSPRISTAYLEGAAGSAEQSNPSPER